MLNSEAFTLALKLQEIFTPYCERFLIAGGIRRSKPDVHDIDIVALPKSELVPSDLFGWMTPFYPIHSLIDDGIKTGSWKKIRGATKLVLLELPEGIHVDLNLVTPPAQWGVKAVLGTGPSEFNHWIVTSRTQGGCLPSYATMKDGGIYVHGNLIQMPEEIDFLDYLGLGWITPKDRQPKWRHPPVLQSVASV